MTPKHLACTLSMNDSYESNPVRISKEAKNERIRIQKRDNLNKSQLTAGDINSGFKIQELPLNPLGLW